MFRRTLLQTLVFCALVGASAPALAQRHDRQDDRQAGGARWDLPRREGAFEQEVPLSQVLRELKRRYGGEHLDARREGDFYIIVWVTSDGRRLTLRVNARTGQEG